MVHAETDVLKPALCYLTRDSSADSMAFSMAFQPAELASMPLHNDNLEHPFDEFGFSIQFLDTAVSASDAAASQSASDEAASKSASDEATSKQTSKRKRPTVNGEPEFTDAENDFLRKFAEKKLTKARKKKHQIETMLVTCGLECKIKPTVVTTVTHVIYIC